jgi:hypothetical protein
MSLYRDLADKIHLGSESELILANGEQEENVGEDVEGDDDEWNGTEVKIEEQEVRSELTEEILPESPESPDNLNNSFILGKDILQLEACGGKNIKVTVGQYRMGKLLKINDTEVSDLPFTEEELMRFLCQTNIQKLKLAPLQTTKPSPDLPVPLYSVYYRNLEDGPLGISVEFVPIPIPGFQGEGLRVHYLAREYPNSVHFALNDIILAVNGMNFEKMEKKHAINLLTGSRNRRVVIIRGSPTLASSSSEEKKANPKKKTTVLSSSTPDPISSLLKQQQGNPSNNNNNNNINDHHNISNSLLRHSFPSSAFKETMNAKKTVHTAGSSFRFTNIEVEEENLHSNFTNIRSNFLCKTLYKNKSQKYYNSENHEYVPKYRFTSDLKTAMVHGQRSYKNIIIQTVQSRVNVENA